jgi:hypothetical protein
LSLQNDDEATPTTTTYSARAPWMFEPVCAMNALLPTLEDFSNSLSSSPWINASMVAESHTMTLPKKTARETPLLFSKFRNIARPSSIEQLKALASKKNNSNTPLQNTKDEKQKDVEAKNNNRKENCRDAPTSLKKQLEYPIVETKDEKQIDANARNHNRKEITVERSLQPIICVGVNE